ncbi:MAG: carbohydrate kinase [Candidatus Nanopelagicaceae bacterium]|nr:carbohydrate kinase [Candidatus Nanopelagicaceae bacterium]
MSVWVCGEVLVDRLGESNTVGGGPANTARAIARLGQEVEFIGGISTDEFGVRANEEFARGRVGMRHVHRSNKPTASASVSVDAKGQATYQFTTSGTATFDFALDWLPDPYQDRPSALHIGTLATVIEPGASVLFEWATRVSEFAPIIFDPNVRTQALSDRVKYLNIFERWASISTAMKASEEELGWLYPNRSIAEVISQLMEDGIQLLVITRGDQGIRAVVPDGEMEIEAVASEVVDTVGAGDTVGAVLVDSILRNGILNLRGAKLYETLNCAVHAAAITCSRVGAQPPTRSEIDAAIERSENAVH